MAELDRRITVKITRDSFNRFGEPTGETDDYPQWAAFVTSNVDRVLDHGRLPGLRFPVMARAVRSAHPDRA